jgi:hydroxyquinol 1,2-dioxygenase
MGRHPYRPAHIHTMISHPGHKTLTTHIFVAGDAYLASDAVFGVKDSLVVDFVRHPPGATPDGGSSDAPFSTAQYDFVLAAA